MAVTEEQKNWVEMLKTHAERIGILAGFKDLQSLHGEWIRKMLFCKDMYVLKAHRSSYKTSCLEIVIALFIVLKPNCSIFFVRKTDDDVKEVVEKVQHLLKKDVFRVLTKVMHGVDLVLEKETAFAIDTNLNQHKEMVTAQLLGFGLKGSMTGKHCDILILDDICNTKDRESFAERELTKRVYFELNNNIKKKGGITIVTGTTWHVDDVFSVMPPAEIKTCYETGLLTEEQIQQLKDTMPPDLFAANYELRFVASGDCLFTTPKYTDDETLIYDGICHVDAGYGGNDYTAFCIVKKVPDEEKFIAFGKLWHRHVNDCIPEIENLIKKYRCGTLYLETNGDKGYLAKEFRHRKIRCVTYHERMNKHAKISTYLYKAWKNMVWLKSTDEKYIGQILDYTEMADHDDALECANLLRVLDRGKVQTIKGINL